ncbi:unnamed protein product, partial [Rotaria sp. Silwood1]
SFDYNMNVEGIEEFLNEFKRETYGNRDVVTVGEANGVSADQAFRFDQHHQLHLHHQEEEGKFSNPKSFLRLPQGVALDRRQV